jgi:GT2 family glycosyltransferase
MKVSVIIPTLEKNKEYARLCIESLRATVDWDIFVASNGGHHYNMSDIPSITSRLHSRQQGQGIAVNRAAQVIAPDTDYILISNDDMYYAPGWNKNLDFTYPVFSPNLLEPSTGPGSAPPFNTVDGGLDLDTFNRELVDKTVAGLVDSEDDYEEGYNFPVFIRKDVWDSIGGYDPAYDPWGSNGDTDLQAKIHLAGIQTMRARNVVVYHFGNKSGTFDGTHQDEWQRNWDYFTQKWGFNRDTVPGCDVWYSKNILPADPSLIAYSPDWVNKYA